METNNQFHCYEKIEFDDFMSLDERLQRSMQVPFETNELTYHSSNNFLIEYPPSFFTQENSNNNVIFPQTFENNISCEAELHPWDECSSLYEGCFSTPPSQICPTTITTTTNNNNAVPCTVDMGSIPKYPTSIDQKELNNPNFFSSFLNYPNNHIDYFIDAPLDTVVVDEINLCPIQGNTLESDNYNMISTKIKRNNNSNNKTSKIDSIQYEEIRKYFDMPIVRAAKELSVSVSSLRRRCRKLNIKRWPYRKIKSLETLVSNVKEMGIMEIIQKLEENKEKLHYLPGLDLTDETKRLRQVCFKANYKKKEASLALRTP